MPTAGQRKRANVVLRSAEGGYSTVISEERPGDAPVRVVPLPLDEDIELVPVGAGVLVMSDGAAGRELAPLGAGDGSDAGEPAPLQPERERGDRPRGGIYTIPRDYR